MRTAEWIQIVFASLLALAAWVAPLCWRRRAKVTLLGLIVFVVILAVRLFTHFLSASSSAELSDWVPAALFLLPYWQTGQFFTAPSANAEKKLAAFDRKLLKVLVPQGPKALGKGFAAFFEIAYLTVYPLVPLGLALLYIAGMRRYADYFWTAVLLPTYLCYAVTPFVPALPPRLSSIAGSLPAIPNTAARRFNAWIVGNASIHAITFPSAHVASSVAVALVLLRLTPLAGAVFVFLTIAIAFACVLGGYHYAADVLAGAVVALVLFAITYHSTGM